VWRDRSDNDNDNDNNDKTVRFAFPLFARVPRRHHATRAPCTSDRDYNRADSGMQLLIRETT